MIRKLRLRFIAVTMAIVTLMLIIIFALVLNLTHRRLSDDSLRMMQGLANAPMDNERPDIKPDGDRSFRLPVFRVQVSPDGKVTETNGNYYDLSDDTLIQQLADAALKSSKNVGVLKDYSLRYYISSPDTMRQNASDTHSQNTGTIIVFSDISAEINTMNGLIRNCIIIGIISFLVFLVLSIVFARWSVKPVEDAWNQQRQFVSDASHELKTPLTVILTNAELLRANENDPMLNDPAPDPVLLAKHQKNSRQFIDNIITMSQQMRGLAESLLELARVDNGSIQKMSFSHLDFSKLVENELMTFDALFFERGLTLTENIEKGILVPGSESHLKQVVAILLDNAQKYTSPKGTVEVKLEHSSGRRCLLSVSDPGEPISQEDLKNIFKRFYRVDKARSMNHSYGLGLSIAENIVRTHNGRIWAESENGINTFRVELPVKT